MLKSKSSFVSIFLQFLKSYIIAFAILSVNTLVTHASQTVHVDQPMSAAIIVNVYWDTNWDSENPNLQREKVDAVTTAVVHSSYFGGLSEYGVQTVSFGGSFLPTNPARRSRHQVLVFTTL